MIVYFDTSAIVKLYASESGSAQVKRLLGTAEHVVSSIIAYAETRAALARKYRMCQMSEKQFIFQKNQFESDWTGVVKVSADANLVGIAGELADRFALKGYDAIHLASADHVYREVRSPVRFACFDSSLNRAAAMLGLKLSGED